MPYNFEPIPPSDEINGSTALPLARVKRIIKLDEDLGACSNSAAFLVTVAAEMFIQYLAKQGLKGSQKDRRKNLQYKDLANAVAALDTLEFLSDTIPRTVPYKKIVTERSKKSAGGGGGGGVDVPVEPGQLTLSGGKAAGSGKGAGVRRRDLEVIADSEAERGDSVGAEEEEEEDDGEDNDGEKHTGEAGEEEEEEEEEEVRDDSMDVESTINVGGSTNGNTHRRGRNANGKRRAHESDDEDMS